MEEEGPVGSCCVASEEEEGGRAAPILELVESGVAGRESSKNVVRLILYRA
jgi:hypothetical protein